MSSVTKSTILIVDDTPPNIYALQKMLDKDDRILLEAPSGKEALKIALNQDLDLIILDVQMPDMNGFEVASILKSNKRTQDIPIIFASAEKKEQESILKGFEEGAADYLSKPLDAEVTKAKVAVMLKLQAQKKELKLANEKINQLNIHLQKSLADLETSNKELESFSYSVSHDLRAPLRSISGYCNMLEEDHVHVLNEDARIVMTAIKRGVGKMNTLIDDLLAFSRLGKKEVLRTPASMHNLVLGILNETTAHSAHLAKIEIKGIMDASVDRSLMLQVWVNLLSNAIKYSAKKEAPVIKIGSYEIENEIVYYVKDNGVGFDIAYATKLFQVFQRLHGSDEFEGTGIGLAIVNRIVSKHGGRVWAEAVINEGATFYFSIPKTLPVQEHNEPELIIVP